MRPAFAWMLVVASLSVSATVMAQGRLLEPERAFALSARGLDERTVEARFAIADGYYLYRDKLKFGVQPVALSGAPDLPAGKPKDDPFFGKVAIYRDQVVVRLPLDHAAGGSSVVLTTESQGCADAGVCYPPQRQQITLPLPLPNGPPGALVEAVPAKKTWFK